jgi:hypothetical protein
VQIFRKIDPMNAADKTQNEVFAFLADSATHNGAPVLRIDTHAASVFLAGAAAYKIKRAVRFPFLDYSTLERREAACKAEIAVNQAFAPAIYRRVIAITRDSDGRLSIGGDGTPIEWALEMRRFDETRTLDRIADAGGINPPLAEALGCTIAAAHAKIPAVDHQPWITSIASIIVQNDQEFEQAAALFSPEAARDLRRLSEARLQSLRPLLVARGQAGLIRRCHGDLHLGNVVLIDGAPVLFDAIEFDPLIAAGDVLYDLSFLLMDLIERGMRPAANIVLNRYLRQTRHPDDFAGLAALPLFLSLRAAIRAKVMAAQAMRAGIRITPGLADQARDYFALALRALRPPAPRLIAVGGLSGTGKSQLAVALAPGLLPEPGAVVLRTDIERKVMLGVAETSRLPPSAYSSDVTDRVYARVGDAAQRIAGAGHCVIVDAVFAKPEERNAIAAVARSAGVQFDGLFLAADLNTRLERVGDRVMDASDAGPAVAREQESFDIGPLDWARIDANGSPTDTLRHTEKALAIA